VSGTTTGGGAGSTVTAATLSALQSAVSGTNAQVVQVTGTIDTGTGGLSVGSNKTIVGICGAEIHGHIQMTGSANVIVRNLKIVGYNCAAPDTTSCSSGLDAVTVERGDNHLWFDHDDISDGTDGNLDITHASDYITISWTKFHYSGKRSGDHQFSNLVGHVDNNSEDVGKLRVTFHHDWWADNVDQRQPRVRYGQVHLFNNLYTATGGLYAVGVGFDANILAQNNVFVGVNNPIDSSNTSPSAASSCHSTGNIYTNCTGTTADVGSNTFTPPYTYTLDPAANVQTAVTSGVGPQ
jgi:pectate lyase